MRKQFWASATCRLYRPNDPCMEDQMKLEIILAIIIGTACSPADAYLGACKPVDVGSRYTVCDPYNRTQCVVAQNVGKKIGWIVGRCQGAPLPCEGTDCPADYSVCCLYSNGVGQTAPDAASCPPTNDFGGCLTQKVEAAKWDAVAKTCVPDDSGTLAPRTASYGVIRSRIVGGEAAPAECQPTPTPAGLECCRYSGGATTTVDNTCDNCPDSLPGGGLVVDCVENAYSSGDGLSCIPVGQ